jgi:hypothetical protein
MELGIRPKLSHSKLPLDGVMGGPLVSLSGPNFHGGNYRLVSHIKYPQSKEIFIKPQ